MNVAAPVRARTLGQVHVPTVTLAHGGGGKAMKDLIDDVFVAAFDNPMLAPLEDQARLDLAELARRGDRLAFTTDSFVVDPLFFPGGDIGKLAVCGTVNDLAVGGATPLYLSCAAIIEEGVSIDLLRQVARSMAADGARGGRRDRHRRHQGRAARAPATSCSSPRPASASSARASSLGADRARPGDVVLVNGLLGDHGAAILCARGDMALDTPIESDCAPLHGLIAALLAAAPGVRFLRDATRGGVATVLNEIAEASQVAIEIDEAATPMREEVKASARSSASIRSISPTRARSSSIVPPDEAEAALAAMRAHPLGERAAIIGRVQRASRARVTMRTVFGGRRIVDMLVGEQLPRIC